MPSPTRSCRSSTPRASRCCPVEEGRLRSLELPRLPARGPRLPWKARPCPPTLHASGPPHRGTTLFFDDKEQFRNAFPLLDLGEDVGVPSPILPLIVSGRSVGCCVLGYDQPHPFSADERAVLASLAGLIAQALDRARLYDTKHQLAHTLQTGLLPHTLPERPGLEVAARYLPATRGMDIGGDFYDLIRCETSAAAAIGDVQGHNVNAAALMGQVRTAVHAHATAGASPGEVLARTNRLLTDLDPGLFTSCLYAQIDLPRTGPAGQRRPPAALLRHPDGPAEVLDLPPGLLLGIEPDADYPITEILLPAGRCSPCTPTDSSRGRASIWVRPSTTSPTS